MPPDLTGERFGRLVVAGFHGNLGPHRAWVCSCDCGEQTIVRTNALRTGSVASCGCSREVHGEGVPRKQSVEYVTWANMKTRCWCPRNQFFRRYGGRGITVCAAWSSSFTAFLTDMGRRPSSRHSLDRIDNDGDYCPENCRWATKAQQSRNTSAARALSFGGETLTRAEWSRRIGVTPSTVSRRIARGWSIDRTLAATNGKS